MYIVCYTCINWIIIIIDISNHICNTINTASHYKCLSLHPFLHYWSFWGNSGSPSSGSSHNWTCARSNGNRFLFWFNVDLFFWNYSQMLMVASQRSRIGLNYIWSGCICWLSTLFVSFCIYPDNYDLHLKWMINVASSVAHCNGPLVNF